LVIVKVTPQSRTNAEAGSHLLQLKEARPMATISRTNVANTQPDVLVSPLTRLAGPLALIAGTLFTLTQFVMLQRMSLVDLTDLHYREALFADPVYLISGVVYFAAFCLIMLALVAIYGREGHKAGTLWAVGICAAVVGTLASAGNVGWADVFALPWFVAVAPEAVQVRPTSGMYVYGAVASYVLFTLGWVLFGVASLRARIFPIVICLAIVVGGILGFNASPPSGIPFGLAIAWLGVWMLRTTPTAHDIVAPETH
jgi:hypothetical protein